MLQLGMQTCSVRNVFWDEDEYVAAIQDKHGEPGQLLPVPAPWIETLSSCSLPDDEFEPFWPKTDGASYLHCILQGKLLTHFPLDMCVGAGWLFQDDRDSIRPVELSQLWVYLVHATAWDSALLGVSWCWAVFLPNGRGRRKNGLLASSQSNVLILKLNPSH